MIGVEAVSLSLPEPHQNDLWKTDFDKIENLKIYSISYAGPFKFKLVLILASKYFFFKTEMESLGGAASIVDRLRE
jgi:hypothetical protein